MVFPDWILYGFKKNDYRTTRINSIFSVITSLLVIKKHKKTGIKTDFSDYSRLVQGNRQMSNFIMQDVEIILHHAKLVGVAI